VLQQRLTLKAYYAQTRLNSYAICGHSSVEQSVN